MVSDPDQCGNSRVTPLLHDEAGAPAVRGFLHHPEEPLGEALVLTHGAGSNCEAPLLVELAHAFAGAGMLVLRCDLPFRQARPHGPPVAGDATRDREGLKRAALALGKRAEGRVFLGGHSYGGRQASLLAAAEPALAAGLLLVSYPLHSPRRNSELRTAHFPSLRTPALFVHGSRDPFGSVEEARVALALIPAQTQLLEIEGAGHDLGRGPELAAEVVAAFQQFHGIAVRIPITDVFDLHSEPPREVQAVLEAYLDAAHRKGLTALRIIHGRGIGVQREMVRAVLARTPFVAAYGDAPAEAGGWGATVVTLR